MVRKRYWMGFLGIYADVCIYTDEEVVGKLAELDIVMMDLERANGRIVELERKNVSVYLCR